MAIDEPPYDIVLAQDRFEIRDYRGYVVAQTFVDGDFDAAGNEAFRRLFRYISGANEGQAQIKMTAPVEQEEAVQSGAGPVQQQRSGARWRVAFVLPAGYTLAGAPKPADAQVVLAEVAPRRMAVVRYRGTWSQARYEEELVALRGFLVARGLAAQGEPIFDRYDPPFMPWFLRRNEIQIPVASAVR